MMNDLPDLVLDMVFSYLPISDLLIAEQVSKLWYDLAQRVWRSKKRLIFQPVDPSNYDDYEAALSRCGKFVTYLDIRFWLSHPGTCSKKNRIECYKHCSKIIIPIASHCVKLKHLDLGSLCRVERHIFNLLFSIATPQLLSLHLCFSYEGLTDASLGVILERAVNLKKLSVGCGEKNLTFNGSSLKKLSSNCEYLNLDDCHTIDDTILSNVVKKLRNLEFLQTYSDGITYNTLKWNSKLECLFVKNGVFFKDFTSKNIFIFNNLLDLYLNLYEFEDPSELDNFLTPEILSKFSIMFPNLQELDLSYNGKLVDSGIQKLGDLQHLKILRLSHVRNLTSETVESLAVMLQDRLEQFDCSMCPAVTDNGLSRMVELCTKLNFLEMHDCDVTPKFLIDALFFTKARKNEIMLEIRTSIDPAKMDEEQKEILEKENHPLLLIVYEP